MDFSDENNSKPIIKAQEIEEGLVEFIENLISQHRGARKPIAGMNKGFYYYFIRNKMRMLYQIGCGTEKLNFQQIWAKPRVFNRVLKTYSAKFRRYIKLSKKHILKLKNNPNRIVNEPTLAQKLSILDFIILTENLPEEQVLALLKGKSYKHEESKEIKTLDEIRKILNT